MRNIAKPVFPWEIMLAVLLGRRRSFHQSAQAAVSRLRPPLRILGVEHIPATGPALLTPNHFSTPAWPAWWLALAVSAAVPFEVHWIVTANLRHLGRLALLSRWALRQAARVYDFTLMPAMPPAPAEAEGRVRAIRQALDYAQHGPGPIIGLAPEGRDFPGARLGAPPPGAGRFLLLLHQHCTPIIPVGVYEDGGLCLRFGPSYRLELSPGLPAAERDRLASQQAMHAIAALLPEMLQGEYGN